MSNKIIRIMLIDDHIKVHHGMSALIDAFDDLELIAQGSHGKEALDLCARHQPDIVLMDVVMPEMDGIEATKVITERFPEVKVLALSSFRDEESIRKMMQAGAVGYVLKNSSIDDLAHTIRAAHTDKAVFSLEVAQVLFNPMPGEPQENYGLTDREVEVLSLMVEGMNNSQIAEALVIGVSTVKYHVSNILAKMKVTSRVEAVALAVQKKLVT